MLKPKPPKLVSIVLLTTITIILWVFYGLYSTLTKDIYIEVPKKILEPIDPELDLLSLNSIQEKVFYEIEQNQTLKN